MIDIGTARGITSSRTQNTAYCVATRRALEMGKTHVAICRFVIGFVEVLSVAVTEFPIGSVWRMVVLHVVDSNVPMLLSIMDLDRLGMNLNNRP